MTVWHSGEDSLSIGKHYLLVFLQLVQVSS